MQYSQSCYFGICFWRIFPTCSPLTSSLALLPLLVVYLLPPFVNSCLLLPLVWLLLIGFCLSCPQRTSNEKLVHLGQWGFCAPRYLNPEESWVENTWSLEVTTRGPAESHDSLWGWCSSLGNYQPNVVLWANALNMQLLYFLVPTEVGKSVSRLQTHMTECSTI